MVAGKYHTRPPFRPRDRRRRRELRRGRERFKPGDRVMAVLAYGGFAEQAIADEAEKDIWRYIEEIRERGLQANPDDYR
jgi:hypothetical protein